MATDAAGGSAGSPVYGDGRWKWRVLLLHAGLQHLTEKHTSK